MYLVELRPGKEELYRTGDELAAAIRSGEVDGHSRIYHRSTSKWISITLHPQYKSIVAEKPAHPSADGNDWTFPAPQAETLEGADQPPALLEDMGSESEAAAEGEQGDNPWRRPLALGISGLFLVFGIQLAFSGPRPKWSTARVDEPEIPAATVEQATSQQVVSLASTSTAWEEEPAVEEPVEPAPAPKAKPVLPKAPRVTMKLDAEVPGPSAKEADPKTVEALLADYGLAYQDVRSRLGSGVRVARLNQLFAVTRLAPDGGLTDTRLGGAGQLRSRVPGAGGLDRADVPGLVHHDVQGSRLVAEGGQAVVLPAGREGAGGAGFLDRPPAREDRQRPRGAQRRGRRLPRGGRQDPLRGRGRRAAVW
jgi:hypothetical protein